MNNDYRLYSLAHRRLGYSEYAGPFGLGAQGPGAAQLECPCTGPCTMCLIYNRLEDNKATLPEAPPSLEDRTPSGNLWCNNGMAPGYDAQPYEWRGSTYTPWQDWNSCLLFGCAPCTCGISSCVGVCQIGEKIGTPEAIEHTNFLGQIKACVQTTFFCFYWCYPQSFAGNYPTKILHMATEKLAYKSYPMPAGLPLVPGVQMTNHCTQWCSMCLILSELTKYGQEAQNLVQPQSSSDGDGYGAVQPQTVPPQTLQQTEPTTDQDADLTKKEPPTNKQD